MTRASRRPVWLAAVVVVVAVVLNQSAVHWRVDLADSELFAYHGWCVAQGLAPYRDFWDNKPPGIWWLNALGFALCGEGPGGPLLICAAALTVTFIGVVALAHLLFGPALVLPAALAGALLLTDLRMEGGANRTELFVAACETGAVLAYLQWLKKNGAAAARGCGGRAGGDMLLLFSGVSAGAAPIFKQSGLAAAAVCTLHLAWSLGASQQQDRKAVAVGGAPLQTIRRSRLTLAALWLVGLSLPGVQAAMALAAQGVLADAIFATSRFNRAYFAIDDATWLRMDRALLVAWPALAPLLPWFMLAAAGCAWLATRKQSGRPSSRDAACLLGGWLLLAGYLALVGPGRRGYHFVPLLPPLALLAVAPLRSLLAGFDADAAGAWARALVARPARLALLIALTYGALRYHVPCWPLYTRAWAEKPAWHALSRRLPTPGEAQAAVIRALSTPADRIYVVGWSPATYRHAYRLPATRFTTFEKLGQLGPHAEFIATEAWRELAARPPAILVISREDHERMCRADVAGRARWLAENYTLHAVVAGMELLARKK